MFMHEQVRTFSVWVPLDEDDGASGQGREWVVETVAFFLGGCG